MRETEWLAPISENERIAKRATAILYRAVSRALEDTKGIYEDTERAFEEGMNTAKKMLSKVSRGTRKELERNIINPHKRKHSFD